MSEEQKVSEITAQSECNDRLCGWFTARPTKEGWYWCYQYGNIRMVHVWAYKINNPPRNFYTNEDGGASVCDRLYDGVKWAGPIQPPSIT